MMGFPCEVPGCPRTSNNLIKRNICGSHYQHYNKYGDYNVSERQKFKQIVKGKSQLWNIKPTTKRFLPNPTAAPQKEWLGRIKQNIFIDRVLARPSPGATLIL